MAELWQFEEHPLEFVSAVPRTIFMSRYSRSGRKKNPMDSLQIAITRPFIIQCCQHRFMEKSIIFQRKKVSTVVEKSIKKVYFVCQRTCFAVIQLSNITIPCVADGRTVYQEIISV